MNGASNPLGATEKEHESMYQQFHTNSYLQRSEFQEVHEDELVHTEGGYDASQMPSRDEMCGTLWILLGGPIGTYN